MNACAYCLRILQLNHLDRSHMLHDISGGLRRLESVLRRLWVDHGVKALRYCGVSAVNVMVSISVLTVGHAVFGLSALAANLCAWMVATIPAYQMSRSWVWQQSGPHRMGAEVMMFWTVALVGLVLSSFTVRLVEQYTHRTVYVVASYIGVYGVLWVAKYLFLDRVMWQRASGAVSGE